MSEAIKTPFGCSVLRIWRSKEVILAVLSTWFGFDNNRCSIECVPCDLGTESKLCTRCNHGFGHKSEHHSKEVGKDGGK